MRLLVFSVLFACFGLACSSDSGSDNVLGPDSEQEGTGGTIATFSSIQSTIFTPTCATSGCHASGGSFPTLEAGQAYENIVGVASSQEMALIAAGDPDNSYLYRKITGASGIEGRRMPRAGDPLADEAIAAVRAWIEAGALNN
ncbi:MAG: hypothetical protein GKR89_18450 [Candidatus Latescibacteria bacterium]|nr:hypothetical protein [Candidatus Latescibacterota bacterium]